MEADKFENQWVNIRKRERSLEGEIDRNIYIGEKGKTWMQKWRDITETQSKIRREDAKEKQYKIRKQPVRGCNGHLSLKSAAINREEIPEKSIQFREKSMNDQFHLHSKVRFKK